jgi:Tfp pilus assembly major pilin PilA
VEIGGNEDGIKVSESFDNLSSDSSSESEDSDESDVDNLTIEQQLEREKRKSKKANATISALLQQITQYKAAIEGEQAALENQMKEERAKWKKEEKSLKNQAIKLDKQVDNLNVVLNQTAAHYESKLQELEEEKTTRSKETIENLQTLIRELNYIEEVNEDLTRQLDRESHSKKNLQVSDIVETIN